MNQKKITIAVFAGSAVLLLLALLVSFGGSGGPGGPGGPPAQSAGGSQESQPAGAAPAGNSNTNTSSAPKIDVVSVSAQSYVAEVTGYGEASAHYQVTYSAEVSGRVSSVSEDFASGNIVAAGTLLATIENTSYLQAVALAQSNLADARLDLLEEERTGEQVRLQWRSSGLGGEPDSELVLREPQLVAAQAAYENAKYSLEKAEQDLSKTEIRAPFDALIVSRDIQPGSYVQTTTTVATLYSTDRVEVEVPLSLGQWQNLPKLNNFDLLNSENTIAAKLNDAEDKLTWQGYVSRVELHVDTSSRQRSIIVAVDNPFGLDTGLFPGTFVKVDIEGRELQRVWALPSSAISQSGEIWYVEQGNKLAKASVEKYFEKAGVVYIAPLAGMDDAQVIKRPLSNYVVGMQINPIVEG
ncbi:efflux RND transporter periplasmic adaptor subunit [Reinekea thalattae]|uniref:Efflux RND transporter periplasmic adaptor subunit n=1 Tax=Reinekea thalattae TaxID=2593301 RepID=A0A5C8ZC28_9GAMM|nr:efflux RND transporter periplasmic adaptor subunit [Reinekea thalattae]TXR54390.1 efflux RND transporter periplasmic adaptor subunit [Reinekea thalattae]